MIVIVFVIHNVVGTQVSLGIIIRIALSSSIGSLNPVSLVFAASEL